MNRAYSWKVHAFFIGLALFGALGCALYGNTGMAAALVVGAVLDSIFCAVLVGFKTLARKRSESLGV